MSAAAAPDSPAPAAPKGLGLNYWKLFCASLVTNLGDGLMFVSVVWLASSLTRDAFVISLVGFAGTLPWLICSLPAGVITDRFDRRKLVVWSDVTRAVLVVSFTAFVALFARTLPTPAELAAGAPGSPHATPLLAALLLMSLLLGSTEVLRDNAAQTLMPSIVHPDQLERANSRMWGVESVMNSFVGPPLAGVLIAWSIVSPFALHGTFLAVSAILIFSLSGAFRPKARSALAAIESDAATVNVDAPMGTQAEASLVVDLPAPNANAAVVALPDLPAPVTDPDTARETGSEPPKQHWRKDLAEGFGWLWRHPLLRTLALILGLMNMLSSMEMTVFVLYAQDVLGLFQGWKYGALLTGMAAGAVIGSLVADRISKKIGPGTSLMIAMTGLGVGAAIPGLVPYAPLVWVAAALSGAVGVLWNVITVSLRQRIIPDYLLGRVNSVYRFFALGMMALGPLLAGAMVQTLEHIIGREWALRSVFLTAGVVILALMVYAIPRLTTARIRQAQADAAAAA